VSKKGVEGVEGRAAPRETGERGSARKRGKVGPFLYKRTLRGKGRNSERTKKKNYIKWSGGGGKRGGPRAMELENVGGKREKEHQLVGKDVKS